MFLNISNTAQVNEINDTKLLDSMNKPENLFTKEQIKNFGYVILSLYLFFTIMTLIITAINHYKLNHPKRIILITTALNIIIFFILLGYFLLYDNFLPTSGLFSYDFIFCTNLFLFLGVVSLIIILNCLPLTFSLMR